MTATAKKYKLTGPSNDAAWIRQRALDNARRQAHGRGTGKMKKAAHRGR